MVSKLKPLTAGLGLSFKIYDKRSRGNVMAKTLLAPVTHPCPPPPPPTPVPVGDKRVKSYLEIKS